MADLNVSIEVGTETIDVTATVAESSERDELYERQATLFPGFADSQQKTSRKIPVAILARSS